MIKAVFLSVALLTSVAVGQTYIQDSKRESARSDKLTGGIKKAAFVPGVVEYYDEEPFAANTFQIENGKIAAVYRIMNPDKLKLLKNLKG